MGAARHGQEGALAPPPLGNAQMPVFVTVRNRTLEYLNRQQLYCPCTCTVPYCAASVVQLYSIDNFVEEAGLWYEMWANRVNEVDDIYLFGAQCRL